jgi:DNA-binding NarL/FixJ family response regulator
VALSCLLVDDSEEFLSSATRLLSLQGVEVVGRAASADEAVRLVEALGPDVALVDVELGDEDGIELASRLTRTRSGTPIDVVLISLRDREELAELIAGCGAVGFLRKDVLSAQALTDLIVHRRRNDAEPEPPRTP